jgi:hypothetical protein
MHRDGKRPPWACTGMESAPITTAVAHACAPPLGPNTHARLRSAAPPACLPPPLSSRPAPSRPLTLQLGGLVQSQMGMDPCYGGPLLGPAAAPAPAPGTAARPPLPQPCPPRTSWRPSAPLRGAAGAGGRPAPPPRPNLNNPPLPLALRIAAMPRPQQPRGCPGTPGLMESHPPSTLHTAAGAPAPAIRAPHPPPPRRPTARAHARGSARCGAPPRAVCRPRLSPGTAARRPRTARGAAPPLGRPLRPTPHHPAPRLDQPALHATCLI